MKLLFPLLFVGVNAFGWSGIYLGGGNWAIICANGTAWSYSGSSAGLDVVGPALCPGGLAAPSVPRRMRVSEGISTGVSLNIIKNLQETTEGSIQGARTYPPHGYPCLGCEPCPDNSGDYCDIANMSRVVVAKPKSCER